MDYSELVAAAQPDALRAALAANAGDRPSGRRSSSGDLASVREATYKGHDIVIRTTYEITVDGQPFDVSVSVDNTGRVHYHGLPTRDFPSTIALVEKVIDSFPGEFGADQPPDPPPTGDHPDHGHGGQH